MSKKNHIDKYIEQNHKKAGKTNVPGDTPLEKWKNKNRIDSGRNPKS